MSAITFLNAKDVACSAEAGKGVPSPVLSGPLTMQLVDHAAVPAADWAALAGAAADNNVFAEPWMAVPGLAHCDPSGQARIALLADKSGHTWAMVPLVRQPRLGRLPLPCIATWSHPNSFLSPALAARGNEREAWYALLGQAQHHFPATRALLADGLVEGGALHRGLIDAAALLGLPVIVEERTVRAMLATDLDADAYWDASVRAKKRKELRRQWARLGEEGMLTVDQGDGGGDPAAWIAEFMALEASGWKGANGSALASNADTRAFFTDAMRGGWAEGKVLLTALRIDGRAIAMLITLVSDKAGFSFKTAFDEGFARFSPGVLLQRESLGLLTARKLAFIDSCAAQDHPMIDSLWRERRAVVTLSLPLPGTANRLLWQAAQGAARAWRGIKSRRSATPAQTESQQDDPA